MARGTEMGAPRYQSRQP